jgi:hypothetical protein
MKAKFGSLIVDARGKLGGHVASRSNGVSVIRTKSSNVSRSHQNQDTIKRILGNLSRMWRTLTDAERLSWSNATSNFCKSNEFGDLVKLTGFNLFIRFNTGRLICELPANRVFVQPLIFPSFTLAPQVIFYNADFFLYDGNFILSQSLSVNELLIISASQPSPSNFPKNNLPFRRLGMFSHSDGVELYFANIMTSIFGRQFSNNCSIFFKLDRYCQSSGARIESIVFNYQIPFIQTINPLVPFIASSYILEQSEGDEFVSAILRFPSGIPLTIYFKVYLSNVLPSGTPLGSFTFDDVSSDFYFEDQSIFLGNAFTEKNGWQNVDHYISYVKYEQFTTDGNALISTTYKSGVLHAY